MNNETIEEIAEDLVAAFFVVRMVFGAEKWAQFAFRYFKINKFQNINDIIIPEAQGNAQLFEYVVIGH